MIGLESGPAWADWMFAMLAARALGFAFGMFLAARNPRPHLSWIRAMIGVQAIDWLATITYLITGAVTMAKVTTAAFLPLAFMVILLRASSRLGQTEIETGG